MKSSLVEKGGLNQDLITELTNNYSLAIRNSNKADEMQRAIMATYHITSSDEKHLHKLCTSGSSTWRKHQKAEAERTPLPLNKYDLASQMLKHCCLYTSRFQTLGCWHGAKAAGHKMLLRTCDLSAGRCQKTSMRHFLLWKQQSMRLF